MAMTQAIKGDWTGLTCSSCVGFTCLVRSMMAKSMSLSRHARFWTIPPQHSNSMSCVAEWNKTEDGIQLETDSGGREPDCLKGDVNLPVASTSALRIVDVLKKKPAAPALVPDCQTNASAQQNIGSGAFVIAPGPSEETQCLLLW